MARTVVIETTGGPEVLTLVEREVGAPGPGEIRIRHEACGLNFIDVYQRTGLYPLALPHALGMEAAGVIEAVGAGVSHLKPGDRAAYAATPPGAYTEARVMPAAQVCPLPEGISFEEAAAIMLQGMTVEYLFHRVWPLEKGQSVLFHAAAGGVGLLACQWARAIGIRLIGTAGTDEKCALAVENGAETCLNYRSGDFVEEVKALTGGAGVDVVMDGVGQDTFERSLDCLKPLGMMISFGNASGPVAPVSLLTLAAKGSLKMTRTTLFTFLADHARCQDMARHLFDKVGSGAVRPTIGRRYPLEEIAEAHRALEARETTGSTVITL
ncbi:quinone oxidoreductase [Roseovarius sp. MBR-6]|jgi:NADPH2:quinone reductase|uniref:quinone oxidoreductase family protein n=1 Tax=Roseovarius sp. MBR-6 TaxID=3156459 RepID=UPI0033985D06